MKANVEIGAEIVKRDFPEEWERLQERVKQKSKPELPKRIRQQLKTRASELFDGRVVDFGPTKKYPFIVKCQLAWEEDVYCSFQEQTAIVPRKGATAAERAMVKYLDGQQIFEEIHDTVMKSSEVRAYNREIEAFCKEGKSLEKVYDFDFQAILEEESYR